MELYFDNDSQKMNEEYSIGRKYWEMRSYKTAAKHYAKAIQFSGGKGINYDNFKTYYDLGIILCSYGDYQGAEYCYSVATYLDKEMQQNFKKNDTSLEGMAKLSPYYQILIVGYAFQFGHAVLDKCERIKKFPNWKIYVEGYKTWTLQYGDQIPFFYPDHMTKLFPKEVVDFYLNAGIELAEKSMQLKAVDVEAMIDYILLQSLPRLTGNIKEKKTTLNKVNKIKELIIDAEQGNPEAQYNLGIAYIDGTGIGKNRKEGLKWIKEAATQGLADAQYILGTIYINGFPMPETETEENIENPEEGVKWFAEATKQGHSEAQNGLALAFLRGTGIAQNTQVAIELFTKSAVQGYVEAQVNLARCYTEGYKIKKDYEKAFTWWEKAANQGDSEAQYYMGKFYHQGLGVKKDINAAIDWYFKAEKQGNQDAILSLLQVKLENSFEHWKLSAENGVSEAQYYVGRCYYYGCGTKKNLEEAIKWYTASAKQYNQYALKALEYLNYMDYIGSVVGDEHDKAVKQLIKLANNGYDEAQNGLGDLYYYGIYVEQSYKEAARWYTRAAANNFFMGQINLAHMYSQGIYLHKDLNKAKELYDNATDNIYKKSELTLDNIKRFTSIIPKNIKKAPSKVKQNKLNDESTKNIHKNKCASEKSIIEKERELIDAGVIAKRAGDFEKSVEYYKEAVHLSPTNGNTYYALGKVLYLSGHYEEAFRAYLLAYLHNANCLKMDLFLHSGHAVLDAENHKKEEYALLIKGYAASIQGKSPVKAFSNHTEVINFMSKMDEYQKYMYICVAKGKEEILRQAKIHAKE